MRRLLLGAGIFVSMMSAHIPTAHAGAEETHSAVAAESPSEPGSREIFASAGSLLFQDATGFTISGGSSATLNRIFATENDLWTHIFLGVGGMYQRADSSIKTLTHIGPFIRAGYTYDLGAYWEVLAAVDIGWMRERVLVQNVEMFDGNGSLIGLKAAGSRRIGRWAVGLSGGFARVFNTYWNVSGTSIEAFAAFKF